MEHDDGRAFLVYLDALVARGASFDDARLEKLTTRLQALLLVMPADDVAAGAALALLLAGLSNGDYRKVAMCARVAGHWMARFGSDACAAAVWPLLRHVEPLVRHGALYAARVADASPPHDCPWLELVFDESMWVHREAHVVFVRALERGALDSAILEHVFSNVNAAHAERALIHFVARLCGAGVAAVIAPYRPLHTIIERFVVDKPASFEGGAALEVLAANVGLVAESELRSWVSSTLRSGHVETAVMLLVHCPHAVQEAFFDGVASAGKHAAALPLARAMGPGAPRAVSLCLDVLRQQQHPQRHDKWACMACSVLADWGVAVSAADVAPLLRQDGGAPRLVRAALALHCPDWATSVVLHECARRLLQDAETCALTWQTVVRHNVRALENSCIDAYVLMAAADVRVLVWHSLVPWLGPHHVRFVEVVSRGLAADEQLHNVAVALSAIADRGWAAAVPFVLARDAVTRCLTCHEDDCDPALAALAWLRSMPHPDTPQLLQRATQHSARSVRQAAWTALHELREPLCAQWPALREPCAMAAVKAADEAASQVYGDDDDDLLDDPMLDRGEPDCCE